MSKTIEYKDYKFHLGYNDGSRELFIKFLNDQQIFHNGQIKSIETTDLGNEEYLLNNIVYIQIQPIKKVYSLTGTFRKHINMIKITNQWYACIEN